MDIIELTRQLGAAIQQEESYKNFMAAKQRNEEDLELQDKIQAFNLMNMQLEAEMQKEEPNRDRLMDVNRQLTEIYNEVMATESMTAYNAAFKEYNELIQKIMGILQMCQNGEDPATCEPSNCSGDCGSCGGCH